VPCAENLEAVEGNQSGITSDQIADAFDYFDPRTGRYKPNHFTRSDTRKRQSRMRHKSSCLNGGVVGTRYKFPSEGQVQFPHEERVVKDAFKVRCPRPHQRFSKPTNFYCRFHNRC
jgi:hypothetical protein